MKHRTATLFLFIGLCLGLLVWNFGSHASTTNRNTTGGVEENAPSEKDKGPVDGDLDVHDQDDADLPSKFHANIDKDSYLRSRDEFIGLRRGMESGRPFNPEARGRAIEQMERQERNLRLESLVSGTNLITPSGASDPWTPLGPSPLLSAGTNYSGRITSVVVDPTNPSKIYIGTAQGGVWRSLNGGTSWQSVFDAAQAQAIGALALAPSNPSILYVGTGEFNACGSCFFGIGLYRIDNVDTSPTLVGPINPSLHISNLTYNIFNGRSISRIIVHPTDPATIFVATARGVSGSGGNGLGSIPAIATRGIYRSTNATSAANAVTFTKLVVNTDGSVDSPNTGDADVSDIAFEPGNPNNLLAATIGRSSNLGGIYRTTNALDTTPSFTQVWGTFTLNVRVNLAINKVGSTVTAYAATSETPTATPGCVTTNSGAVRKQIDPFNSNSTWTTQLTGGGGFCSGQCFYDMPITVDPNDANVVYIGGQSGSSPGAPCSGVVRRSADGGNTFTNDSLGLHPDDHALFIDQASATIFCGNDGGIYKQPTASAGSAWTNLNNGSLNTLQFESIAAHPFDRHLLIGGTQDNGTEYQISSGGNWQGAESGDGGYSLIDQSATDMTNVTMYHTFFNQTSNLIGFERTKLVSCLTDFNGWEFRGFGFGSVASPSCDGAPFAAPNGINSTDAVLFYAPMALGPGTPNTVYFGTDRLYRSTDRGDTMTVVSQAPINSGLPISTIAIWPGGDNFRIVGLLDGEVWGTSTGSSTFVNLQAPLPANPTGSINKFVGRALIDPNNKNVAYVALSYYAPAGKGIWKITNFGAAAGASPAPPNWVVAGNGIPSIPINALAIDPINSNILYAGTDIGVYYTTDAGANWNPYGTGLPRAAVFDLSLQNANRILRAGTHGRGIWEIPLITPAPSTAQFAAASYPVGEGDVDVTVTVTRAGDTSFPATVNYSTSDTAGAAACDSPSTGRASSRCDYIATVGTLQFAANETVKTISIPIVDDSFAEGSESFSLTLSSPTGSGLTLGPVSTTTITISDNGDANGANPIDIPDFFVRQHYIDFLTREPDASGRSFWVNQITSCGADSACTEVKRINVSAAFYLSIEFQGTGYLVYRLYKAAYGNISGAPVPITFGEFLPDTLETSHGVIVNQGNWQQQLEDNKQAFAEEFVQRARFLSAFPATMTAAQFVDKMNANAAGALSQAERDQMVADLNAGVKTRAQALRAVAEDPDLNAAEFNKAFVLMQYFGYLRRNPYDPPEMTLDYSGYNFWLSKLNQFGGNFVNAEMVKSFIVSSEYRHRFGP